MKNLVWMALFAAGLGLAAFGVYSAWHSHSEEPVAVAGELEWLRKEFKLDETQFARIEEIHAEYLPICDDLCGRVIEARDRLDRALMTADAYSEEVDEELRHFTQVKEECHRSMLQHVYEVASVMEPRERERYLEKARGQVTMHDRSPR